MNNVTIKSRKLSTSINPNVVDIIKITNNIVLIIASANMLYFPFFN